VRESTRHEVAESELSLAQSYGVILKCGRRLKGSIDPGIFTAGAVLFVLAELWRDWFTPNTWATRSRRFFLVVVSLIFIGASFREKSK
jgi:hypothetical protein